MHTGECVRGIAAGTQMLGQTQKDRFRHVPVRQVSPLFELRSPTIAGSRLRGDCQVLAARHIGLLRDRLREPSLDFLQCRDGFGSSVGSNVCHRVLVACNSERAERLRLEIGHRVEEPLDRIGTIWDRSVLRRPRRGLHRRMTNISAADDEHDAA